jgi:hypothetical protein
MLLLGPYYNLPCPVCETLEYQRVSAEIDRALDRALEDTTIAGFNKGYEPFKAQ